MANFSVFESSQDLFRSAISYSYLDYSVIPVFGNKNSVKSKVAGVEWKQFQYQRATQKHFNRWFKRSQFGGIAIVTGSISRLIVLDFDDLSLAEKFANRFPELIDTRIVTSAGRGLPHYYFQIPVNTHVESRHIQGLDLLSDGCYVIAPPTVIDDKPYQVAHGGQPRPLTIAQIRAINAFIDEESLNVRTPPENVVEQPEMQNQTTSPSMPILSQDAIALYRHHAPQIGRNEALFKVALKMRDTGWEMDEVVGCMVDVHVQQPTADHQRESAKQRQSEAIATIKSAFSRPPRKSKISDDSPQTLPTSLREYLLQDKKGYLVRVLDGLLLSDMTQGRVVTEKDIVSLLKGVVGRYSILKSLAAIYPDGSPVFAQVDPSPRPPTPTHVASAIAENTNNKCLLFRVTESDGIQRGRRPKTYLVPDIETLCARFDVKISASDPITKDDLRSTKTYRQAMQREFVKRRAGLYPMKWLAKRLGIAKRTLQRYREDLGLRTKAMFRRLRITWDNLNQVPDNVDVDGAFLQSSSGKKYPAKQTIAKFLLSRKQEVDYVRQDVNYHWHPDAPPSPLIMMGIHPQSHEISPKPRFEMHQDSRVETVQKRPKSAQQVTTNDTAIDNATEAPDVNQHQPLKKQVKAPINIPKKPKAKRYYRKPLINHELEHLAKKLYDRTRAMCDASEGYMSMATARKLADQYGGKLVKQVLQVFAWRKDIENPAGFAVVWLRSEAKREQVEMLFN